MLYDSAKLCVKIHDFQDFEMKKKKNSFSLQKTAQLTWEVIMEYDHSTSHIYKEI